MTNRRFFFPFWYYFGSLLVYFSKLFRYICWDAFLDASFPTFGLKMAPKKVDQKGLRRLWGAPGSQRRPKGHQKKKDSPRPFSNRLPDGGPDASPQSPGPSWDQFGIVFNAIFGNICSYISTLFVSFVHGLGHDFHTVFRYSFWDALYYSFHICF